MLHLSITYEIDEAAKYFALGHSTAEAFHLIRCLKTVIWAMSRCLGLPDPTKGTNRSWHKALKAIKTKMDARWPLTEILSGNSRFSEEMCATLSSLQNPWRNATMHLDQIYTEKDARFLFDAVGGIMKKLASECDEEGELKV